MDLPNFPKILAFDTSGPFIAIGTSTESCSGGEVTDMARGQAEALFPMLEDCLAKVQWRWTDIDALGVGIGPGNFTGIRISVAAARGLAVSLGIPAIGVSNFELAAAQEAGFHDMVISLPAPRDRCYVQCFVGGAARGGARVIDPAQPPDDLLPHAGMRVAGHRATEIGLALDIAGDDRAFAPRPDLLAQIAEARLLRSQGEIMSRPAPLYVRPADAAPPREAPPVILP